MKNCPICKKEFELNIYNKKYCSSKCRDLNYRLFHKEIINKRKKNYDEMHKDKIEKYWKKYYIINKEKLAKKHKQLRQSTIYKEQQRSKLRTNINFKLRHYLRKRIWDALKNNSKSKSTMKLVGCSIEFFKNYYESKFTEGMSWAKVMNGEIHCDHIKPCCQFDLSKPEEQRKCFHYTNLQPLWAIENLSKGSKII